MNQPIRGTDAILILESHGFTCDEERDSLFRLLRFGSDDRSDTIWIDIRDARENGIPSERTRRFSAVIYWKTKFQGFLGEEFQEPKEVKFSSSNGADILAFVFAINNAMRAEHDEDAAQESLSVASGDEAYAFEVDGTSIHNPFFDEYYGDWILAEPPGLSHFVIAHPAEVYGEAYCRWRDALVEATLKVETPTP